MYIYSAVFFPRLPVALEADATLPVFAALLLDAFPAFASLVVFATLVLGALEAASPSPLGLVESAVPSPSSFSAASLAFGFFAGAAFVVAAPSAFFDFLGGFES